MSKGFFYAKLKHHFKCFNCEGKSTIEEELSTTIILIPKNHTENLVGIIICFIFIRNPFQINSSVNSPF